MTEESERLLALALSLPVDERFWLAEALRDSMHPPGEPPFLPSWWPEIRRRSEAERAGKVATIP